MDQEEQKRQMVLMSDGLAEDALQGRALRAVLVLQMADGKTIVRTACVDPTTTLGMAQIAANMVLQKMLGNGVELGQLPRADGMGFEQDN